MNKIEGKKKWLIYQYFHLSKEIVGANDKIALVKMKYWQVGDRVKVEGVV